MKAITAQERDILANVWGYQDPDEILHGSAPDEIKEHINNILMIIREGVPDPTPLNTKTPDFISTYSPDEKKNFLYSALDKVEEVGVYGLTDDERIMYKHYLFERTDRTNDKGQILKLVHADIEELTLIRHRIAIINQIPHIYDEESGVYRPDYNGVMTKTFIKENLEREFIEDTIIKAIYNLILSDSRIQVSESRLNNRPKHWIHFRNGYYDYKTEEANIPHNPDYYETNVIPWDWDPEKYPSMYSKTWVKHNVYWAEYEYNRLFFDEWIEKVIPDWQDRDMLYHYIAYAMTLDTSAQKFLLICGPGGTGKSTLLRLIEEILGQSNISNVSLQALQTKQFYAAELYHKQANICADIPLTALSEVDVIKKLTGEDRIAAEKKYKDIFMFKPYARLFFSANDIPFIAEKTNAFYRRLLILKMDQTPTRPDPTIIERLIPEIPNIITRVVEWYTADEGDITISDNCRKAVKEARKNSDTIEAFLDDKCEIGDYKVPSAELYRVYQNYCTLEERQCLTRHKFYEALKKRGFNRLRNDKNYDIAGLRISEVITFSEVLERAAK